MSKTVRIYNRRDSGCFVHPWHQVCFHCRCSWCRNHDNDPIILRKRRYQQYLYERDLESRSP